MWGRRNTSIPLVTLAKDPCLECHMSFGQMIDVGPLFHSPFYLEKPTFLPYRHCLMTNKLLFFKVLCQEVTGCTFSTRKVEGTRRLSITQIQEISVRGLIVCLNIGAFAS